MTPQSEQRSAIGELVVCQCCGHTEDLETAKELWAATYVGGHLFNSGNDGWHGWLERGVWRSV